MILTAILTAALVAGFSIIGAFFFGSHRGLIGLERYIIPAAVGVFLSLVLFELIPETLANSPEWGGLAVAAGFIGFYILAQILHNHFHRIGDVDCDRKSAASLLLVGDAIHNLADGIILGGAFLIDPTLGVATGFALALHEIPQELVEFGVLIRAGYSRLKASLYNLISASSIIVGTIGTILLAETNPTYVWILTGIAAGNLLFLAASDLLPRIHGNLSNYGNIWKATTAIVLGFTFMTLILIGVHQNFDHGHSHETLEAIPDDHHHD